MSKMCLAVDIGASSGRLMLGRIVSGKLQLEEIHRFKNQMYYEDHHHIWDVSRLYKEIIIGLKKCGIQDKKIESIGVDTWAVDYVLLDQDGQQISPIYAYRDGRTKGTMEKVMEICSKEDIYKKTGIQFLPFNTLYQLYEHTRKDPQGLCHVSAIMMIPDYIHFLLCDRMTMEYTNGTTTQMYNISKGSWDEELLTIAGIHKNLIPDTIQPGTILGTLTESLVREVGLKDLKVIAPATHDTGSAVVSVPAQDKDFAYISSGTWSLMGVERDKPICTTKALGYNFTNEGGAYGKVRILKNIMGLWLIQEVKRLYHDAYSFHDLAQMAEQSGLKGIINPNNICFLNPSNMIEEIQNYCAKTHQEVPETPGEIARCIFESLALQYKQVLLELSEVTDLEIKKIHIVGGGSQNTYLNQLCANYTNCDVYAGPIEATAIGNLAVQYITLGVFDSLEEARKVIYNSFDIMKYIPKTHTEASVNWERFITLP